MSRQLGSRTAIAATSIASVAVCATSESNRVQANREACTPSTRAGSERVRNLAIFGVVGAACVVLVRQVKRKNWETPMAASDDGNPDRPAQQKDRRGCLGWAVIAGAAVLGAGSAGIVVDNFQDRRPFGSALMFSAPSLWLGIFCFSAAIPFRIGIVERIRGVLFWAAKAVPWIFGPVAALIYLVEWGFFGHTPDLFGGVLAAACVLALPCDIWLRNRRTRRAEATANTELPADDGHQGLA